MAQPQQHKARAVLEKPEGNAYRVAFEEATKIATATETLQRCAELEAALDALRVRYEQYFLGLTRTPPSEDHQLVRAAISRLRQSFVRNTSARFRVQSLHNRFLSYERMWMRTTKEIEEGTYRRDLFKARLRRRDPAPVDDRRAAARLAALRKRVESAPADDDFDVDEVEPEPPPAAARPAVPAPAARNPIDTALPPVLQEEKLRKVYDAYVSAKKRCRESTDGLTYEAVASALRRQIPALLEQHKASTVDFKVVIKGGKAVLKAVPR